MTNQVIDRAMRAAFKAWQDDMVRNGKTSALNAKFDDIAPRDRRLIELQCRAAIASLKEISSELTFEVDMSGHEFDNDDMYKGFKTIIDAALKDT